MPRTVSMPTQEALLTPVAKLMRDAAVERERGWEEGLRERKGRGGR
jgi:hypothetical protein